MTQAPEQIAQDCADSIKPELFRSHIKRAADEIYGELLEGVQDYLLNNIRWNISTRIETAEREARLARAKAKANKEIASELLEALESACDLLQAIESLNEHIIIAGDLEFYRAAIAKAKGGDA